MTRRTVLVVAAAAMPGLAGCTFLGRGDPPGTSDPVDSEPGGGAPSVGTGEDPAPPPGGAVDDATVEPFVVKGMVTHADGRPLPGAEVFADNTLTSNSNLKALSGDDGRYRIEIPETYQTSWQSRGWVNIDYHGEVYRRELDVNNDPFQTNQGAVRDLVLKLSGTMTRAPSGPGHGAEVHFHQELTESGQYHDQAKIEVTLVPVGPLLDGSTGETITMFVEGSSIGDIPIGQYEVSVRHHRDDGSEPVACEVRPELEDDWSDTAVGVMPPELALLFQYRIPD